MLVIEVCHKGEATESKSDVLRDSSRGPVAQDNVKITIRARVRVFELLYRSRDLRLDFNSLRDELAQSVYVCVAELGSAL